MHKRILAASLIVFGLGTGWGALAQSPLTFAQVDTDNSGTISPGEMQTAVPNFSGENFQQADSNNDGFLDPQEFTALSPAAADSQVTPGATSSHSGAGGESESSGGTDTNTSDD